MNRAIARQTVAVLALAAFAVCLTACNTVAGAGKDLQEASENTSEAIDNAFD